MVINQRRLNRTVIVRMRWHDPTIAYVARRTAEGLSKREIIRCLKRYLVREVFLLLTGSGRRRSRSSRPRDLHLTIYRTINAQAESVWSGFKRDAIDGERFATKAQSRWAIFSWFVWYNSTRLHTSIGNRPPIEFERHLEEAALAA